MSIDEPTRERGNLDRQMAAVLLQITVCSHVGAAAWGPSGRSRSSDEPLGGQRPPGDLGATYLARAYGPPFAEPTAKHPGARDDNERRRLLQEARDELEHIRGHGGAQRARPSETPEAYRARLLDETRRHSPDEVEQSRHKIAARTLRKWRRDAGLDQETGERLAAPDIQPLTGAPRRIVTDDVTGELERLRTDGHSFRSIELLTGIPIATIHRHLNRRAA